MKKETLGGLILVLSMAGCSEITGSNGRFQGIPTTREGSLYVVDTRTGEVQVCIGGPTGESPGVIGMSCFEQLTLTVDDFGEPPEGAVRRIYE